MIHLDRLPNQIRGEKTVLFLRRHWVELLITFITFLGLSIIPLIILGILSLVDFFPFGHIFWGPLAFVLLGIYSIFVVTIIITQITDYYLDTWIVTTERIINIEQQGLFSRVISELHLNEVQDITAETHGMFATFLTFGDVYIQTAATRERFNFKNIDNPEQVKQQILKLVRQDKLRHGDPIHPEGMKVIK